MPIPQVPDRMKEAPTQALRAVFAGVGQLLLAADKIKTRVVEASRADPAAADGDRHTEQPAAAAPDPGPPPPESRWRSLDKTGNVRLLTPDELELPLPNYDELSVAALRGHLRSLDSAQLRVLLDYEQANAGREAVLQMFERRMVKLENGEA